jgi:hypothetical protein
MVEVFKTNVTEESEAAELLSVLAGHLPACTINFDLQDCDNILRVKGDRIPVTTIISLVSNSGFDCTLLV